MVCEGCRTAIDDGQEAWRSKGGWTHTNVQHCIQNLITRPQHESVFMLTTSDIDQRFEHKDRPPGHKATEQERVACVKDECRDLTVYLNTVLPESREKSLALTAIQEAALWAQRCIELHGGDPTRAHNPPH